MLYIRTDVSIQSANMFDDMFNEDIEGAGVEDVPENELDDYLSRPPETFKSCPNPLRWWYEHRERYPRLSRMALDYLSIPGTY